jgi:hypothetical protein
MWRHPEVQPWANGAQRQAIDAVAERREEDTSAQSWRRLRRSDCDDLDDEHSGVMAFIAS